MKQTLVQTYNGILLCKKEKKWKEGRKGGRQGRRKGNLLPWRLLQCQTNAYGGQDDSDPHIVDETFWWQNGRTWEIEKHEPGKQSFDIYGVPSELRQCIILAMGTSELKMYCTRRKCVSDCRRKSGTSHAGLID